MLAWTAAVLAMTQPLGARAEMPSQERTVLLNEALAAFDLGTASAGEGQQEQAAASYRHAAAGFEALVADGVENGKLYYNLGNTYLQLGEIGRAILNYRRAESLIGSDAQLEANLRYARSLRRNQIEQSGEKQLMHTVFFWHFNTPIQVRYLVALVAYVLFWLVLLARMFVRRVGLRAAALCTFVTWMSAGASVGIDAVQRNVKRVGVTIKNDITVRKGNGDGYDPQFNESFHEGVEFVVVDERSGWYKIELPDGNTGWIRQTQAELV